MRAIGYTNSGPSTVLQDIDIPSPLESELGPHDLLIDVAAVSVNPVDTKVRSAVPPIDGDTYRILGWDASGVVVGTGADVTLFSPGDAVFYAGTIGRRGTNSEQHVVDERIVGSKPTSLSHDDAAALPLTTITAWELLFEGMSMTEGGGAGESLLIINGAGGVGSILTQIARTLTDLTVVATASRPETSEWCEQMGAHHVINHHEDMGEQLEALGLTARYVASLTATDQHWDAIIDLIEARGRIALIDDPSKLEVMKLKGKALTLHIESMFARPEHQTADQIEQHRLLDRVAGLVDLGKIRTTANHRGGTITAANLQQAHEHQESGRAIGKTVLVGF